MSVEAAILLAVACFLAGMWLGIYLVTLPSARLVSGQVSPTRAEAVRLLNALGVWAQKFDEAKPSRKYLKRREADLFAEVRKVGTIWLRTSNEGERR